MLQKHSGKFERYLASTVLIIWYSFLFCPLSFLLPLPFSFFFLKEVQILIFVLQLSLTSQYTLSELPTPGKSGSFFYYSNDRKFMLKTISATEFDNFLQMLPNYFLVCFCFFSSSFFFFFVFLFFFCCLMALADSTSSTYYKTQIPSSRGSLDYTKYQLRTHAASSLWSWKIFSWIMKWKKPMI